MTRPTVLIAGGGTGGHVFPGVAVAEALHGLADLETVFCGTDRGVEARVVPARGWRLETIDVRPIKGGGPVRAVTGSFTAARAMLAAFRLVHSLKPRAVLSVGGYAAGPISVAAAITGVPTAVLEPNSVVGLTNRWLSPFARRAYVAWEDAAPAFRPSIRRHLGTPLRPGFVPRPYAPHSPLRVLVMGGSQGASALNERVPEALAMVAARATIDVLHQAGRDREVAVRDAYGRANVDRVRVVPFIDDVASAIADSDVVLARAGAGTIAEIAAIGRASILVPFPHAADDHQHRNAAAMSRDGAAVCLPQSVADPRRIADEIARLVFDDDLRGRMARAARLLGRPNAARDIAADLLSLARISARIALPADDAPKNGAPHPRGLAGAER